jgi:transposase-like protein
MLGAPMLSEPYFHNEDAAHSFFESRLWPAGPVCPHCRGTGEKVRKLKGKSTRRGTYKCYECGQPFTVKIGTVFESSHLGLHLWLQAIYLVSFAKRRITIRELQQTLGIARKTAWTLKLRIRELITREDGPAAVVGNQRSAVAVETLARAETETARRDRMKPASPLTIADSSTAPQGPAADESKGEPNREHRKRRPKRPLQDPRQGTLFQ